MQGCKDLLWTPNERLIPYMGGDKEEFLAIMARGKEGVLNAEREENKNKIILDYLSEEDYQRYREIVANAAKRRNWGEYDDDADEYEGVPVY